MESLHRATAFYTTDPVVHEVLDAVNWPAAPGRLLDPGVGNGQFLGNAVARLDLAVNDVEGLLARVEGWEIHPGAVAEARARLVSLLVDRGWQLAPAAFAAARVVVHADFLAPGPVARRYRVVCGNPPYLAYGKLPSVLKARYDASVPAYARRDVLHAFLARVTDVLTDDGVVALVTSDRWLFNETAAELRAQVGQRFGVSEVRRLSSTSTFFRPKARRAGSAPRVHPVAVVLRPADQAPVRLTSAPIYPTEAGAVSTPVVSPAVVVPSARTLGDIASVSIAPWLGTRGVFYLEREAARAAGIPEEYLVPCVEARHLRGSTVAPTTLVAVRTHGEAPLPDAILAHLHQTVDRLPPRARRNALHLPPEGWAHLPHEQDVLVVPRISRTLRVLRLPAGILPINHNMTVVSSHPTLSLDALAALITAPRAQAWMAQCAPRIEGGFYTLNTRLLRQLPVDEAAIG